ncbi:hypothetical protein M431DRAFT_283866 [Trichoderma harzianum CBS 226.95]|uniref:Uncharacterized protein n=1 Tax=Trichoderma harzianum CBS 226.95 TaxID=983964 RepID=A0A2T4ANN2_TRIHA|nr:hypothetical protein M431DRAFT_283866 [Trichoderma harzianum CBS 226.95]PTB58683.1 hypothetical protein M431DRAFT_283866 [Trichoderma harzianum CBS 226.95]
MYTTDSLDHAESHTVLPAWPQACTRTGNLRRENKIHGKSHASLQCCYKLRKSIKSRETKISWASEAHHPEDPLVKVLHLLHSKLILYCASGDKGPGRPRKRMPLGLFPLVDVARLCSWRAVISPPCLGVKYYQSLSNLKSKDRVVIELLI